MEVRGIGGISKNIWYGVREWVRSKGMGKM